MKFVVANVVLFVAYTGLGMIGTWTYVRGGQDPDSILRTVSALGQSTALPVACIVNWWLCRLRNEVWRICAGIGLGLLACAIAFVPYFLIGLKFHLAIGGTL